MRLSRQNGAGLMEVMVALFVLAIGLLGFAGLQNSSLVFSQKAYANSQAAFMTQDILERMRANRDVVDDYTIGFDDDANSGTDCAAANCTAAQMAAWDLSQWKESLRGDNGQRAVLPDADGEILYSNVGGVERAVITVRYRLREAAGEDDDNSQDNAGTRYSYEMRTQI
jgi:type IV pilus assembly protein PilV|tara:strand:- start:849 stop:1355 length:507 start_codon:yes stop_codon:yes gene_type:complete